ncbi:DUF1758 domain-containing protein [Nephila pilipes]|uniref:DUF1758 domain-containing protein n=1 Tax=Nephila pilipes TaxID=299642 RepID=A0A8X6Q798_NEPPI|nr:DUF1758 domain-containing protein [Nephila pilipes]
MILEELGEESVNHVYSKELNAPKRINVNLSNVNGSYNCELEVLDEKKICASLPRMNVANCLNQLKDLGILTSDAMINEKFCLYEKKSGVINLHIGADYAGKLLTGNVKYLSGDLVTVHTLLEWTVMGKSDIKGPSTNSSLLVLSLRVNEAKITDLWKFGYLR